MKRPILIAVVLLVCAGGAALADQRCTVPLADWQPREIVQQKVEADGWKVTRIKTDDGCYKVGAVNDKGDRYEAKIDPGSLKVLKFSIEHKEPK